MVAARINQMQSFMALMQMAIMPMFFLSGALFPVANLPQWLAILNRLDPLTYAVDPMRRAVFAHLDISAAARQALDPGVTWWGWHVPTLLEAAVIAILGLVMLAIAIGEFSAGGVRRPSAAKERRGLSAWAATPSSGSCSAIVPDAGSARRIASAQALGFAQHPPFDERLQHPAQRDHRPDPARRPHARRAPFDAALDRVDRLRERGGVADEAGRAGR